MSIERGHAGWSELPHDIAYLVVNQKQLSLADIGRMAAVCKSWRSILQDNEWFGLHVNANIGKIPFPWLMLAECLTSDGGKRVFFNPATRQVSEVYLPEAEGRRCCGSGHGWIVTMGEDMEINLLNPLTREQLNLPSQLTFDEFSSNSNDNLHLYYDRQRLLNSFIRKAILTCNPRRVECVVVALLGLDVHLQVAFAKPGDSTWTLVPLPLPMWEVGIEDFIFYGGLLYSISGCGRLMVLDLNDNPNHAWQTILSGLYGIYRRIFEAWRVGKEFRCEFIRYLVEMGGELVVVVRAVGMHGTNNYQTRKVDVFKPLPERGEWSQMKEIGDCCMFLGTGQSTCISPAPRGYHANCIYFTDDFDFTETYHTIAGHDMAVYSMDGGEFSPFYHGVSLSQFSPPLWVTLNSFQ